MEEQTTTETPTEITGESINGIPVDDNGSAIPVDEDTENSQPETHVEKTAESQPEEAPEFSGEEVIPEAENVGDNVDTELERWAANKGLSLDSENAIKAAQMAREAERAMHSKAQRTSQLERSITDTVDSPELADRISRVESQLAVQDFYALHPEAKDYDTKMAEILYEKPYLGQDLEALYAVARVNDAETSGGKKALESLANKQKAAAVTGRAVTSGVSSPTQAITSQNVDQMVAAHDQKWFEANYDAINEAMAG